MLWSNECKVQGKMSSTTNRKSNKVSPDAILHLNLTDLARSSWWSLKIKLRTIYAEIYTRGLFSTVGNGPRVHISHWKIDPLPVLITSTAKQISICNFFQLSTIDSHPHPTPTDSWPRQNRRLSSCKHFHHRQHDTGKYSYQGKEHRCWQGKLHGNSPGTIDLFRTTHVIWSRNQ